MLRNFTKSLGRRLKLPIKEARELKLNVCLLVASGHSLTTIAKKYGISPGTILGSMVGDSEFRDVYREAKEMYYMLMAEDLIDIIDDADPAFLDKAVQRVKTRQWVLERACRGTWAKTDTVVMKGDPDNPVQVNFSFEERVKRIQDLMTLAASRLDESGKPKVLVDVAPQAAPGEFELPPEEIQPASNPWD